MGAFGKRVGLVVLLLDLFVGVAAAGILHHGTAAGGKMSASRLEQVVAGTTGARTSCSADPDGGWDYLCSGSDGSRGLYDVSAHAVTQHSTLPSFR